MTDYTKEIEEILDDCFYEDEFPPDFSLQKVSNTGEATKKLLALLHSAQREERERVDKFVKEALTEEQLAEFTEAIVNCPRQE